MPPLPPRVGAIMPLLADCATRRVLVLGRITVTVAAGGTAGGSFMGCTVTVKKEWRKAVRRRLRRARRHELGCV